MDKRI